MSAQIFHVSSSTDVKPQSFCGNKDFTIMKSCGGAEMKWVKTYRFNSDTIKMENFAELDAVF